MEYRYEIKKSDSMKRRKRVGRGMSSGIGKTSGRGQDGQKSRSGSKKRVWFEGGQMPLQRRVPKRGFNNIFKKYYQIVNMAQISKIDVDEVNPELLQKKGVISKSCGLVKILGDGELGRPVKITADAFSNSAREIIEKAGGEAEIRNKSKGLK